MKIVHVYCEPDNLCECGCRRDEHDGPGTACGECECMHFDLDEEATLRHEQ